MRYAGAALLLVVASCGILPTRTEGGRDGGAGASAGGASGGGGAAGGRGGAGGAAGGHAGNGGAAGMACTASSCSGAKPVCDSSTKMCRGCASSNECGGTDAGALLCAPSGACVACVSGGDCTVTTKPVCDQTTNTCRACAGASDCPHPDGGSALVCAPSGACVACVMNADCATATKPICNTTTNTCRACATDTDCPADPGVCMTDGHCATTSEVIFVDYNSTTCPGNGSSTQPYCTFASALTVLTAGRHVVVVVGGAGDRLSLATTGMSPVLIGRKNSSGDVGSIPATNMVALSISSDTVLVRDLTVNLGSSNTSSKGIVVMGTGTNVTLLRVTASLGLPTAAGGMGVDAETGTTLTMNSCTVTGNGAGGMLLNGANFDVENTTVTNNGPGTFMGLTTWGGVLVNMPPTSGLTKLSLLTIESNMGGGITCSKDISAMASGVLASGNMGTTFDINPTCNFSSCGTAGTSCGAQ